MGVMDGTLYLNGEPIGKAETVDIEPETESSDIYATLLDTKEASFTARLTEESTLALWRMIFTRGQRNAQILKRDGYLSPANAEME